MMDFIEITLTWIQLLNMNLEIIDATYVPIAIINQLPKFAEQV